MEMMEMSQLCSNGSVFGAQNLLRRTIDNRDDVMHVRTTHVVCKWSRKMTKEAFMSSNSRTSICSFARTLIHPSV